MAARTAVGGVNEHEGHQHGAHEGHHGPHGRFDPTHLLAHEESRRDWMAPELLMGEMLEGDDAVLVDVGAGTGFLALAAAARLTRGRVIAVDRQDDMVTLVRRRADEAGLRNLTALKGEAERLPVPDLSADAVLFSMVLHDMADPVAVVREARRVLRPGGRLLLIEFLPGATEMGPPRETLFEPAALTTLVTDAGYAVTRRWQGPGPLYRLEARVAAVDPGAP